MTEAMGDAAYGDGGTGRPSPTRGAPRLPRRRDAPTRPAFPRRTSGGLPEDFRIDLEAGARACPAGHVTRRMRKAERRTDLTGRTYKLTGFQFEGGVCGACPLRPQCVAAGPGIGRTVRLHPQEALLQQARALQRSEAFTEYRCRRLVAERRLARLVQLGVRQSRYFGRVKTRFQLCMAATVANLTLIAAKAGMAWKTGPGPTPIAGIANLAAITGSIPLRQLRTLIPLASISLPKFLLPTRGFRPSF